MATTSDLMKRAAGACLLACALATSAPARADDPVEEARKAFVEAYASEKAGRYAEALAKLAEVRRVRDTASVRYRIGACEEALGHLVEARESYLGVEAVARADDHDVVTSAKAKAREIEAKLGELSLRIDGARGGKARVDDREVSLQEGQATLLLPPGEHRVVYAPEGEPEATTPITLEPGKKTLLVLDRRGARAAAPKPPELQPKPAPKPPPERTTGSSTLGIVSTVAGGALLAASLVSLALRESAIGAIEEACPASRCPRAKEPDVESAKSRAELLMPVAVVTGAAGVLALGAGVYFLVRPLGASASAPPSGLALGLGGAF